MLVKFTTGKKTILVMTVEVAKKVAENCIYHVRDGGCRLCEKVKCHVLATEHITSPSVVAFQTFLFYQISKKSVCVFPVDKAHHKNGYWKDNTSLKRSQI